MPYKKRQYIIDSFVPYGTTLFFDNLHRKQNEARLYDKIGWGRQGDMANYLGISSVHMSNILTGKVKLTLSMAAKIAEMCNVSIDRIYEIEKKLGLIE